MIDRDQSNRLTSSLDKAILEREQKIDLIFSDVVMPGGMTSYKLALFARQHHPSVRILLTSGYDAAQEAATGSEVNDLRVLRKRYNQANLARALREVLASSP